MVITNSQEIKLIIFIYYFSLNLKIDKYKCSHFQINTYTIITYTLGQVEINDISNFKYNGCSRDFEKLFNLFVASEIATNL